MKTRFRNRWMHFDSFFFTFRNAIYTDIWLMYPIEWIFVENSSFPMSCCCVLSFTLVETSAKQSLCKIDSSRSILKKILPAATLKHKRKKKKNRKRKLDPQSELKIEEKSKINYERKSNMVKWIQSLKKN